jgi:hypothetical protein
MFTLVTFVPPDDSETLLEALFAAGAGRLGNYDRCAFIARGEGRFRPLPGSVPAIGISGKDEVVIEDRIECVVPDDRVDAALTALHGAHPYETPAVYLWRLDERCVMGEN